MIVLFLNHKVKECGVYQYGNRLCDILQKTPNITYHYRELDSLEEYNTIINEFQIIDAIIYNYYDSTMYWLNDETIQKKIKNIGIYHESIMNVHFDYIIDIRNIDIGNIEDYIPRPIFEEIEHIVNNNEYSNDFINSYKDSGLPIFGSFGFSFDNKGFDKIVKMVNDQYDEAVIKLLIPKAHFDVPNRSDHPMFERCKQNVTKPGIILKICKDFFTNEQVLSFLHSNTMNIFMYDLMMSRGLSSTIDYALSVRKPIGISNSDMFRHIYSDDICLYKVSIQDCLSKSLDHCQTHMEKNSNENLINKFVEILYKNCVSRSQSYQDIFVSKIMKEKLNGCFLEIGSNHPTLQNNTYLLEDKYHWKGLMVEYDSSFKDLYITHRPNSIYEINDARCVDYKKIMDENDFPSNMDYLQIDLHVKNKSTLDTLILLNDTVFDKYKFATITFKHDIYSGDFFNTQNISRSIFKSRGYVLVFPNVSVFWEGYYKEYEDWYVHPDLVDMEYIHKVKSDVSLRDKDIAVRL